MRFHKSHKILLGAVLAVAIGLAAIPYPKRASAQVQPYSEFQNTTVATVIVAAYSDTAGIIPDGTVVMQDTTSTYPTRKRFNVLPWDGNAISRPRILGVAFGNIPVKGSLVAGKVLVMGYHANVKMAASGLTAGALLKTGVGVNGSMTTVADSLSGAVGRFLSYASNSTAANSRGKCYINAPLARFFGSL